MKPWTIVNPILQTQFPNINGFQYTSKVPVYKNNQWKYHVKMNSQSSPCVQIQSLGITRNHTRLDDFPNMDSQSFNCFKSRRLFYVRNRIGEPTDATKCWLVVYRATICSQKLGVNGAKSCIVPNLNTLYRGDSDTRTFRTIYLHLSINFCFVVYAVFFPLPHKNHIYNIETRYY